MGAKRKVAGAAVVAAARQASPRAGAPPAGTVGEDAVERLIHQWLRAPKLPADHIRLPRALLLQEADALLAARADVAVFVAARTPIKEAAFDYVDVLVRQAHALPRERATKPKVIPKTPKAQAALEAVGVALGHVLRRAEANARAVRSYELSRAPATPGLFIAQLLHVVQGGRRRAERWDDPETAMGLFRALEKATLDLETAWKLTVTGAPPTDAALRAMALDRLLFDALVYLAAYGRAVFEPSDKRHATYTLRHMFPARAVAGIPAPLKLVG